MAPAFKELAGWKPATPMDAIDRGAWWSVYRDPVLDGLERQADVTNQTIKAAEAAYRQAAAEVRVARASLFPVIGVNGGVRTNGSGGGGGGGGGGVAVANSGVGGSTRSISGSGGSSTTTNYTLEGTVDWDLDLWGRIRRQVESNAAAAEVSAADLANARLSVQVAIATDYFQLRGADALQRLLDETVAAFERSLQIAQNQYKVGIAARSDVITAQSQLEATRAQAINVGVARAQFEHAIAVLIGHPPAELTLGAGPLAAQVPVPPPGLPSALLERRPDIAAAERTMVETNALIGVQTAAYYPDVTLSALYGFVGSPVDSLIQTANRVWSLGASASQTLFEGGARSAAVEAAQAAYDQSVATYRQTVLDRLPAGGGPAVDLAHPAAAGGGAGTGGAAGPAGGADLTQRVPRRDRRLQHGGHQPGGRLVRRADGTEPAGAAPAGECYADRRPGRRLGPSRPTVKEQA